jgi:hypothetical protein
MKNPVKKRKQYIDDCFRLSQDPKLLQRHRMIDELIRVLLLVRRSPWLLVSRLDHLLCCLFAVEQAGHLLDGVALRLDEKEPGEDDEDDLNRDVDEVILPR